MIDWVCLLLLVIVIIVLTSFLTSTPTRISRVILVLLMFIFLLTFTAISVTGDYQVIILGLIFLSIMYAIILILRYIG